LFAVPDSPCRLQGVIVRAFAGYRQRRSRGDVSMIDISKAGTFKLGDRVVKRMGYRAMQLA
jgi:hypothetical protein